MDQGKKYHVLKMLSLLFVLKENGLPWKSPRVAMKVLFKKDTNGSAINKYYKEWREKISASDGVNITHLPEFYTKLLKKYGYWRSEDENLVLAWTAEEDNAIVKLVDEIGTKRWSIIAERLAAMRLAGTKRTGKQCRTRWLNHLDPTINKGPWTKEEERTIYEAQKKLGMYIFIIHHTYVLQHIFQICIYIYCNIS